MRRVGPVLVVLLFVVLAGCARGNPSVELSPRPGTPPTGLPSGVEAVSFPAADGEPLTGQWWTGGPGSTVVVLSNDGANNPEAWGPLTGRLLVQGYALLTYSFRYPHDVAPSAEQIAATVADLRGAITYARGRGVTRIVLIGASLGGMATAKVAGAAGAIAVVIIASPPDLPQYGFSVAASELASLVMPKLFVSSVDDPVVPLSATRAFHDAAPGPKLLKTYVGSLHGLALLYGTPTVELGLDVTDFLAQYAAP